MWSFLEKSKLYKNVPNFVQIMQKVWKYRKIYSKFTLKKKKEKFQSLGQRVLTNYAKCTKLCAKLKTAGTAIG